MAVNAYERLFRRIWRHKNTFHCHAFSYEIFMLGRISESLDFKEVLLSQDEKQLRRDNLQLLQEITEEFERHVPQCRGRNIDVNMPLPGVRD